MLKILNSLTGAKEAFTPLTPGQVRMYVCGMTVYDLCHLGHARMIVVFDMVVRYLRWQGLKVNYVRNITDIDDKIIRRAEENGESIASLTERYIEAMHQDTDALGVIRPDVEPRATDFIPQIIEMVGKLIERGYAYRAENGDVYYDVSRFEPYGKLSGKSPQDLRSGARVEINEAKDDPLDFVLWKAAKAGEPAWESPWGQGRPGWHIECSAMSTHCLGHHFDIHGGGMDLQFPHHENEIAQSEAANATSFVELWMHNGFVRVNEEKMSKSLKNFFTVRELLGRYRAEDLRYFILASHYRSPLNYSDDQIDAAVNSLTRLYQSMRDLPQAEPAQSSEFRQRFIEAMDDDFNTPQALTVLHEMAGLINKLKSGDPPGAAALSAELEAMGNVLGLLERRPEAYLKENVQSAGPADAEIESAILQRNAARKSKNWKEADRLRDWLSDAGVVLEDGAQGTTWRRMR
jgi:cysteinyl-tRNA synthetase